jgi:hypothetical protein
MTMRLTLSDIRQSRLPRTIGLCQGDLPQIADAVNAAQQRLIEAGGETGWWGSWVRVAFNISRANPYISLPRQFARIINMDVLKTPININNEFYEMLVGGPGLMPEPSRPDWCGSMAGFDRGTYPTMADVASTNQYLRVYFTDPTDAGKTLLITGLDQNGLPIYGQIGNPAVTVDGFPLVLAGPFVTTSFIVTSITAVQKDITAGDVILKSVDATTGAEVTLSRYGPTEVNPAYRRYYITKFPAWCCPSAGSLIQVTAICKLEYLPVTRDTDQLVIGNLEALIEECKALRFSEMESIEAFNQSRAHHAAAIKLLQNEMRHYLGEQRPAVAVDIFQGAPLERAGIGTLI